MVEKSSVFRYAIGTPLLLLLTLLLLAGCGSCDPSEPGPEVNETRIYGTITVDETLDDTRDYSGIALLIRDLTVGIDTLFHAVTDSNGYFDGTARFPRQDYYELQIIRNDRWIADTTLILAHQDTIHVEGTLPRFAGQAQVRSVEHEAWRTMNRLQRQYGRVIGLASAGALPQDTIPALLDQWSDIYWEVFERWPETLAARDASEGSIRLLLNRDEDTLMRRLNEYGDHEHIRRLASRYGFLIKVGREGLDAGIAWIDSLESESISPETRRQIGMSRIEILYDSARTGQARSRVSDFEAEFGDDMEVERWLETMRYDIDYLSPGQPLPSFEIPMQHEGDTLVYGPDVLAGTPAVIEVVNLADRDYQLSYNELRMAHMIFEEDGIRFFSIPVQENPITINAFYQERGQYWPVATAGAYVGTDLEERWNIFEKPVRFIIDNEGRIVRKLYGNNINELITELNKLLMNNGDVL